MNEEEKKSLLERLRQLFKKKDTEIGVVDSIETKLIKKEDKKEEKEDEKEDEKDSK